MPFSEDMDDVVRIITSYYQNGGIDLIEQYGDQAPSLAMELSDVLEEWFSSETPFGPLWAEYKQDPVANEAEVIGALEMLEEAVPEIGMRLEGYYAAFQHLDQEGVTEIIETSEPEDTINVEEVERVKSTDDFDDDDEYREENTYLVGNVEDRSTSAMYIEGLDTSVEPNESSTVDTDDDLLDDDNEIDHT
jgi:hypothetical protein